MANLTCERWSELLAGYADGSLAPSDQDAVERHAAECSACRQFLEDYLAVPDLVRRATYVSFPEAVRARLTELFKAKRERRDP
jgi:anti-sigma factor RsiW